VRERLSMGAVTSFDRRSEMKSAMARKLSVRISDHSTLRCSPPSNASSGSQLTSRQPVAATIEVCTR
jgi:hypothetical protein